MKLTKRAIDAMKYEGVGNSRDIRWDDAVTGFGIRIFPSGNKSYVISYRVDGRKRLMTLKGESVLTLHQARQIAKKHLGNTDTTDPLEDRQKKAQGDTVKELCNLYMNRHAKQRKKSWSDDLRRIERHIIPAWGSRKAGSIKRYDAAALHSKVGQDAHYEANRVLALLSKMFSLARQWGVVDDSHVNPARDIEKFKEKKRDRWITHEELPLLAQAIDEEGREGNLYARHALWLYLLTGLRKNEILCARWDDIKWDRNELKIAETKAGRTHYASLSTATIELLNSIPRLANNAYIIPGKLDGAHLVNIDKPWQRSQKESNRSMVDAA